MDNLSPEQRNALSAWSTYGQQGAPQTVTVKGTDWQRKNFQKPVTSSWNLKLKPSLLPKLRMGFLPRDMDDKWFVYSEEPEKGKITVHFHRSWTGLKIAEIEIEHDGTEDRKDAEASITKLVWESSEDVMRNPGEKMVKDQVETVCRYILKADLNT
ncbi:hypothetical protein F5884DRAFT_478618 [Xylogone sp. PMI_703]|nr:hypothetical protein F5884DRAFT_478618 [Xylogone sp. PMI_703]